jgi:8-oxo-dGTP pyrophosphatase MutT (NUDIX family)
MSSRLDPTDDRLRVVLDPPVPAFTAPPGLRAAAVLAPWVRRAGEPHLLFTRRCADLPHHAGQVSFPGGAREGDEDPLSCALRESEEELGLPRGQVTVLGGLPGRRSIAGYWVEVVVGAIPAGLVLSPDPREVAAVVEMPLWALAEAGRWSEREVAPGRTGPVFEWQGEVLWGLTARFVLELLERLHGAGWSPGS